MSGLEQELLSRQIGSGYVRMQPQQRPMIDLATWKPITDALSLLPEDMRDTMPSINVRRQNVSPAQWSQVKEASVDQRETPRAITLMSSGSNTYDRAAKGNGNALKELAALLAHERKHAINGPDESTAYDTQLRVLRDLGASDDALQRVLEAKQAVTRR